MKNLYYQEPSQEVFEEMKKLAIEVWKTYDDQFGYATDKIASFKDIENVSDNFMYILAMFDTNNQLKLLSQSSDELRAAVRERLVAGGAEEWHLNLLRL